MAHYSENEISFFNQLLYEYDIRIDGREKMEIRNHEIKQDIVTTCFSSLKICYNNSKNEIYFAIKGELVPTSTINENNKVINLNIDSIQKSNENTKVKSQIENILNSMLIEKTPVDNLKVENSKPEMIWKIYVDVFVFDFNCKRKWFKPCATTMRTRFCNHKFFDFFSPIITGGIIITFF